MASKDAALAVAVYLPPSPLQRTILALLSSGSNCHQIGSSTYMSRRTVYREVARLKEMAGVNSIPALTAAAARNGWLADVE